MVKGKKRGASAIDAKALVAALVAGREVGEIGDAGAQALAASAASESLRTLSLRFAGIGPTGAAALAASPHLAALSALDLEGNDIGDDGAQALASSSALPALRSLRLGHTGFGERGLAARNSIGPRGATAIARSKPLARLDELGLPIYEIDPPLAAALAQSPLARFLYLAPGSLEASRASPDGRWTARIHASDEVWPDGPRAGILEIGDLRIPDCSPSMVWSGDSKRLAIALWTRLRGNYTGHCRLAIVQPPHGKPTPLPGDHGPLALWAFEAAAVRAFDAAAPTRQDLSLCLDAR